MELNRSENLRAIVMAYAEAILAQVQQSVLCNALHTVKQRLSRWLLMMHDRAASNSLPLTQEFLADILAANRGTVTVAARSLQAARLIRYTRGNIEIIDRRGLEDCSCECYRVLGRRFKGMLPPRAPRRASGRFVAHPTDKC
jgi:hypothetical protein